MVALDGTAALRSYESIKGRGQWSLLATKLKNKRSRQRQSLIVTKYGGGVFCAIEPMMCGFVSSLNPVFACREWL